MSARFAHTDYPAEIEDLIADSVCTPSIAAVAGYAIIASTESRALIFAIAAGSGLDAVSLPLQPLSEDVPPALALWQTKAHDVGAAALTSDGVLRIFRRIDLRNPSPQCEQIRVSAALTPDREVRALRVVYIPKLDALFIVGAQGTAAIVSLRGRLSVQSVGKNVAGDRSSRIGSMFYSAIRSISAGIGRDDEWTNGTGGYEIMHMGVVDESVVVVKRCGEVEKWGAASMTWSFNVFDRTGGRDLRKRAIGAGLTTDGTIVLLIDATEAEGGRTLVCFDVRGEVPSRAELILPIEQYIDDNAFMIVSGDIAYLYMQRNRALAWMSIARGVPAEGQVRGSTTLEADVIMFAVVDASFGLSEATVSGGVAACLHASGVWLASSAVPAPVSLDVDAAPDTSDPISDAISLLWRSFLQYGAGQNGASKATLRGLVNSLVNDGFNLEEALSDVVEKVSRKIITSEQDPDKNPMALLIDTELERKQRQHRLFVQMLSDGELFAQLRPNAPSIAEDRVWDAIRLASRSKVLADNEKLAAASKVRDIENMQPGLVQRFNDAASNSFIASSRAHSSVKSAAPMSDLSQQNEEEEGPSLLKSAILLAGKPLPERQALSEEESATALYRYPFEFHRFLPALEQCVARELSRLFSDEVMSDAEQANEGPAVRRAACSMLLLACEASVAISQGSNDAREENVEMLSHGPNRLNGVENWVCDYVSCRKVLYRIADRTLRFASRISQGDRKQLTRAATLVIEELLNCASKEATAQGVLTRESGKNTPQKRRRVDLNKESSAWGKELRSSLDMLRHSGLDEETYALAERFGDYGMMLSLRVSSPEFDKFFEGGLQRFGDEFAFFGFQWLEERGKIHLLLRGRSKDKMGRSERVSALLTEYFRTDRENLPNLSWMHWLAVGDLRTGSTGLVTQIQRISKPEKPGSTANTRTLASIAKLALLAGRDQDGRLEQGKEQEMDYASGKLELTVLQESVEAEREALIPNGEIIRRLVNEGSNESEVLAGRVIRAVDAVTCCAKVGDEASNLEDYVWRRCVERQKELWMPLVRKVSHTNDIELREKLMSSALFSAAKAVSLTEHDMAGIVERGAFQCTEFATQGCVPGVTRLVKATVALAATEVR